MSSSQSTSMRSTCVSKCATQKGLACISRFFASSQQLEARGFTQDFFKSLPYPSRFGACRPSTICLAPVDIWRHFFFATLDQKFHRGEEYPTCMGADAEMSSLLGFYADFDQHIAGASAPHGAWSIPASGAGPINADRVKATESPSFQASPFLGPVTRQAFDSPDSLVLPWEVVGRPPRCRRCA